MPEHKYTPGNWVAREALGPASNTHIRGPWVIEADGKQIATLRWLGGPGQEWDARLMAAAPDLLEALEAAQMALIGYTHQNDITRAALDKARATIAKALGQA